MMTATEPTALAGSPHDGGTEARPIPTPEPPPPSRAELAAAKAAARMDPLGPAVAVGEVDLLRAQFHLAEAVAPTEFVPKGLRGDPAKVLAAILSGRELGVGPMTALREISIIKGRPNLSAELQLALIRWDGHSVVGHAGADRAELTGTRADNGDSLTVVWTLDRAVKAGLVDNVAEDGTVRARSETGAPLPWESYTESMLWARAVTELATRLFSDVVMGTTLMRDTQELGRD
jgi:hypothetical protein